jgi:hypothetical protein
MQPPLCNGLVPVAQTKFLLDKRDLPSRWYNLQADLPRLLPPVVHPGTLRRGTLMCFPYAGGNAVNFQSMASSLQGSGLAVYAVELLGHDLAGESEPFAPMAQIVEQVVAEIVRHGLTRVLLWGRGATLRAPRSRWRRPGTCRRVG